jgi:hypothetical protein
VPRGDLRQGSTGKAGGVGEGRTQARASGQYPQCAEPRLARRSQVRHRLYDGRQGRSQGESGWHLSRGDTYPDRLSSRHCRSLEKSRCGSLRGLFVIEGSE